MENFYLFLGMRCLGSQQEGSSSWGPLDRLWLSGCLSGHVPSFLQLLISIPPVEPSPGPSLPCPALPLICYTGFCPLLYISKFVSLLKLCCAEVWKQAPLPTQVCLVYVHPVLGDSALCSVGPETRKLRQCEGIGPLPSQQNTLISHHGPTVASGSRGWCYCLGSQDGTGMGTMLTDTALFPAVCNFMSHEKCLKQVKTPCTSIAPSLVRVSAGPVHVAFVGLSADL